MPYINPDLNNQVRNKTSNDPILHPPYNGISLPIEGPIGRLLYSLKFVHAVLDPPPGEGMPPAPTDPFFEIRAQFERLLLIVSQCPPLSDGYPLVISNESLSYFLSPSK